jgi:predicted SpoU family rRNA methylase
MLVAVVAVLKQVHLVLLGLEAVVQVDQELQRQRQELLILVAAAEVVVILRQVMTMALMAALVSLFLN